MNTGLNAIRGTLIASPVLRLPWLGYFFFAAFFAGFFAAFFGAAFFVAMSLFSL